MALTDIVLRMRLQGQNAVASGIGGTTSKVQQLGRVATGAVFGVGLLGAAALDAAGDYEKSLNVFQAVSSATSVEMKRAGTLAKELGADVRLPSTSAADAAEAMTELARGGILVSDIFAAAKPVLQLSAAAQIGNAQAADITAKALNTFGMQGREAIDVANLLAAASMKGAKVTDLASGLQQAGADAHRLGVPLQDLVTSLTLFARRGVTGSDAGTSMKTMMQRLLPQSKDAAATMKRLGIDVFDAQGRFIGLRGTIKEYGDALRGKSQEEQAAALQTLFGSDASRAAGILLLGNVKAYDKLHAAVTRHGAAERVAKAQTKGYKGALDGFKSTVETLEITWGEKLLPTATAVMQFLSANLEPAVDGVAGAVKDLYGWSKRHDDLLISLAAGLGVYVAGMKAYAIWAAVSAFVTGGWTTAFWALDAAMAANPVALVVLGIAALAAGLVYAYRKSATFRDVVHAVGNALKDSLLWGLNAVIDAITFLMGAYSSMLTLLSHVPGMGWAKDAADQIDRARAAMQGFADSVSGKDGDGKPSAATRRQPAAPFRGKGALTPLHIPKGLAGGGRVVAPGSFTVGEDGVEVVDLPRGAVVRDAPSSRDMGAGLGALVAAVARLADRPVILQVNGREIARANATQLANEKAFA